MSEKPEEEFDADLELAKKLQEQFDAEVNSANKPTEKDAEFLKQVLIDWIFNASEIEFSI